jgi:hypothetical protein
MPKKAGTFQLEQGLVCGRSRAKRAVRNVTLRKSDRSLTLRWQGLSNPQCEELKSETFFSCLSSLARRLLH